MKQTQTDVKRNPAIEANIEMKAGEDMKLVLKFANGKFIVLSPGAVDVNIQQHAMMHGFKQKLVDAAAISRDTATGRPATIDDKYQAVKTVFDRLLSGEWNAAREGGSTGGLLLQALIRMHDGKKTVEQLREWLATKTDAEKTALRKNPKVATIIEEIRAETGKAANVDTDALLDELDAE